MLWALRLPLSTVLAALAVATPASAAACPGAATQPTVGGVVSVRAAVVCVTNQERARAGLRPLIAEGRLERAAQLYARRIVAERFFSHVGPDGSTLAQRLSAYAGWRTIGENLAWGGGDLATPRSIVASWMRSPGHRANLMSSEFAEIGLGVTPGSPTGRGGRSTYVATFGARSSSTGGTSVARAVSRPATS